MECVAGLVSIIGSSSSAHLLRDAWTNTKQATNALIRTARRPVISDSIPIVLCGVRAFDSVEAKSVRQPKHRDGEA